MKMTLSILVAALIVVGFGLIGDALAQPDNPSPAATVASGDGSAADEAKPEDAKPDETKPDENKPSEPAGEAKKEGEEEAEGEAPEGPVDQAKGLYSSIRGGQWILALGFFGMLLGSIGRYAFSRKWDFWKTKAGGYTIAGITGMALLGAGLVTNGGSFSMELLASVVTATLAAMAMHGPAKAVTAKMKPAA